MEDLLKQEEQIKSSAADIAQRIKSAAHESTNEAEFRRQAVQLQPRVDTIGSF